MLVSVPHRQETAALVIIHDIGAQSWKSVDICCTNEVIQIKIMLK